MLDVDLQMVPCGQPKVGQIQTIAGTPTLVLRIPTICQELTHICDINWNHDQTNSVQKLKRRLVVAFDRPLQFPGTPDLPPHIFLLSRGSRDPNSGRTCWCEVEGKTRLVRLKDRCKAKSDFDVASPGIPPNAILFEGDLEPGNADISGLYRVVLKCDLLADEKGRAPDGNHLPPWFNTPNYTTGDGVAGGEFYSWFELQP